MLRSSRAFYGVLFTVFAATAFATNVNADSIKGYEITSGESGGSFLLVDDTIVVSGGEVIFSGESSAPIIINGDSRVVLKDVSIKSKSGSAIVIDSGVKAEIVLEGDNTVAGYGTGAGISVGYKSDSNMAILKVSGDGTLNVTGGAEGGAGIGGNGTKNANAMNGEIMIEGGTIIAKAQNGGAGIGGGMGEENLDIFKKQPGKIVIKGGDISATGGDGSAGIGGGNNISANIEVSGGKLNEVQGGAFAAGIGGGRGSASVDITITGGSFENIHGYESSEEEKLGGAAIGTGSDKSGYSSAAKLNIKISDGKIKNATAGWGATNIGNGANNTSDNVVTVSKAVRILEKGDVDEDEVKGESILSDTELADNPEQEAEEIDKDALMWGCISGGVIAAIGGLVAFSVIKRY